MSNGDDKSKDIEELRSSNSYNERPRNTTVVLSQRHYNFLQSVKHNEMKVNNKNVTMNFIIKEALIIYEKNYSEKYGVKVDDKGFIK